MRPGSRTRRLVLLDRLLATRELGILVVTGVAFVIFSVAAPRFLSAANLVGIVRDSSLLCIVAVGMTYLLAAGEFDLSVGSNYGFLVTVLAFLIVLRGFNPWIAGLAVMVLGGLVGVLNAVLVTKIKLQSFLVTLGSMAVLRGAANVVSGGYPISARDESSLFFTVIGGRAGPLPNVSILMLAILLLGGVVLAKTRFGYWVYATGGNEESARLNGIPTERVKLICFALTGVLCGLIATLLFGWIGLAPYNTGIGFELKVIAAAVIGGAGLFGGRGTILGTFIGAILLAMLANGLILLGFREFWDGVAAGIMIVLAAGIDVTVRRGAFRLAEVSQG